MLELAQRPVGYYKRDGVTHPIMGRSHSKSTLPSSKPTKTSFVKRHKHLKDFGSHKRLRTYCKFCNHVHSWEHHRFHGHGAYRRTHHV